MPSATFTPLRIRSIELPNRVGMSPMCMYSCFARDGVPTAWHMQHLGSRAAGGQGIIIAEATGVHPTGRISLEDTGIWNEAQVEGWKPITAFIKTQGSVPAIQLAHAGRKAGTRAPWLGGAPYTDEEMWDGDGRGLKELQPIAPSAIAFREDHRVPKEMSLEEIAEIKAAFVQGARNALEAGFEIIELHFAHGYLIHEFLSPLSNHRTDQYGGSLENRLRLPLEIIEGVRGVWPEDLPLFVRISASDWTDGGWDVAQSIEFAKAAKVRGVDMIDVSSGALVPVPPNIPLGQGYQLPYAEEIRKGADIPVATVGGYYNVEVVENILKENKADLVLLGRELLRNPYWAAYAREELGEEPQWPKQYGWGIKSIKRD